MEPWTAGADGLSDYQLYRLAPHRFCALWLFFKKELGETDRELFMPHTSFRPLAYLEYTALWLTCLIRRSEIRLVYLPGEISPAGLVLLRHIGQQSAEIGIGIARRLQGRGHGKRLMQCIFDLARRRKLTRLTLTHHPDNVKAARLYAGLGFEAVGERRLHRFGGRSRTEVVMEMEL